MCSRPFLGLEGYDVYCFVVVVLVDRVLVNLAVPDRHNKFALCDSENRQGSF